jgi:hypothetical protein
VLNLNELVPDKRVAHRANSFDEIIGDDPYLDRAHYWHLLPLAVSVIKIRSRNDMTHNLHRFVNMQNGFTENYLKTSRSLPTNAYFNLSRVIWLLRIWIISLDIKS